MRIVFAAILLGCGCQVDVGAGKIDPVSVDDPIFVAGISPPLSLDEEMDFLSADQSASIADQYGKKLKAVDHIDLDVKELAVQDEDGVPVPGADVTVTCDGVQVDHAGVRVRLSSAMAHNVLAAIAARQAVTLPVTLLLDWPDGAPGSIDVHALFQPIVVVNALEAL